MRYTLTRRPSAAHAPGRFVTCALVALCASSVARGGEVKEDEVDERVRKLVRDLEDRNRDVRRRAAVDLSRMGPAARDAVRALTEALKDT
ncbi:MAG: hypothetical protein ACYSU0_16075, partial [Planctomycetota bacterium]